MGLRGVMYTDAMQGTIMFVGMIFLLFITYSHLGGIVPAHQLLPIWLIGSGKACRAGDAGWTTIRFETWWWTLSPR